jgi:glucosamine kinase
MKYLAVDVGGTSTRAVIVEDDGTCIGYGTAGSGNPTSFDGATAVSAIAAAMHAATKQARSTPTDLAAATVGIAGTVGHTGRHLLKDLVDAGLPEPLKLEPDLLVAFLSGSLAADGYALVAGTGAAAVRIRGGRIEATSDGLGWLVGDAGSGFWIGRRVVRAAASALDSRGPSTSLVELVLATLGLSRTTERSPSDGRLLALRDAVEAVYRLRPVELARFAPLAFEAESTGDDVAGRLVASASDALAATLAAVVVPEIAGPLVLSGSILSQQASVARRVVRTFRSTDDGPAVITVSDGLVGAVVLVLRHGGVRVDDTVLARVRTTLAALR